MTHALFVPKYTAYYYNTPTNIKKRGNRLSSVPLIEAFALPDTAEQTTLEPTPI